MAIGYLRQQTGRHENRHLGLKDWMRGNRDLVVNAALHSWKWTLPASAGFLPGSRFSCSSRRFLFAFHLCQTLLERSHQVYDGGHLLRFLDFHHFVALKFGLNEQIGQAMRRHFKVEKSSQAMSVATGILAGMGEGSMIVPFELIKVRMQDPASAGKYINSLDCMGKIVRSEGMVGLFKGLEATMLRSSFWTGGYFGVIHYVRGALPAPTTRSEKFRNDLTAGVVGGTAGTLLNTPFDVVKSRVQGQLPSAPNPLGWAFPALRRIAQKEGVGALYKGFVPKVLRLGPGGGIMLIVFDAIASLMQKHLVKPHSLQE